MREAIGGAALMKIIIVIIVAFNAYLALSVNYSKAFRVKNQVINLLEQYETYANAEQPINEYLNSIHYQVQNVECDAGSLSTNDVGVCIYEDTIPGKGYYYKVTTFININVPIFNMIFNNPFKINGETKMIYRENQL